MKKEMNARKSFFAVMLVVFALSVMVANASAEVAWAQSVVSYDPCWSNTTNILGADDDKYAIANICVGRAYEGSIVVDMGTIFSKGTVYVNRHYANATTSGGPAEIVIEFYIYVSPDGSNWTCIGWEGFSGGPNASEKAPTTDSDFTASFSTNTRYVKIRAAGNCANNTLYVDSVRIESDFWMPDSEITSGLQNISDSTAPTVFCIDGTWYLISAGFSGFYGYKWTGSAWEKCDEIVSGLGHADWPSAPAVFCNEGTWYLIYGDYMGRFHGFRWTGSCWVSDSSIISGLEEVSEGAAPSVFFMNGTWNLITPTGAASWKGYRWTGAEWVPFSKITLGLPDSSHERFTPRVFYLEGEWYLIMGDTYGEFHGYNWTGSCWQPDETIVSGLEDTGIDDCSSLTVFFMDGSWHLIAGGMSGINGVFRGYAHPSAAIVVSKAVYEPGWEMRWQNVVPDAELGDTLRFRLDIYNNADSALTNVSVVDRLPESLEYSGNAIVILHGLTTHEYNFTDTTNNTARYYTCEYYDLGPADFNAGTVFSAQDYLNISSSDNIYKVTSAFVCLDGMPLIQHNFKFKIAEDVSSIKSIKVTWEGHNAFSGFEVGEAVSGVDIKTDTGYEAITTDISETDASYSLEITGNISNYLDDDNCLYIRAYTVAEIGGPEAEGYAYLYTDFVEVEVTAGITPCEPTEVAPGEYEWTFSEIEPGQHIAIEFDANAAKCGIVTNSVNVTADRGIFDDDEASVNIRCPDLIITAINAYHENPACPPLANLSNTVDVTVENIGDADAKMFNVSLYVEGELIGRQAVSNLGSGNSTTVKFEWTPVGEGIYYNLTAFADCDSEICEHNETNNELSVKTFVPSHLAELVLTDVNIPSSVDCCLPYTITACVSNKGLTASGQFNISLSANGTLVEKKRVNISLGYGENITVSFRWTPSHVGMYELCVVADCDEAVDEMDETNNILCANVNVRAKIDLKVTAIKTPANIYVNESNIINATIANTGTTDAGAFNVSLNADGIVVDRVSVSGLSAGASTEVSFEWTPSHIGLYELKVIADSDFEVDEVNESNNELTKTLWVCLETGGADLIPIDIKTPVIYSNMTFPIDVVIANGGCAHSGMFNVTLYADGAEVGTTFINDIPPGENTTVTFKWTPDHTGDYNLTAIADPDDAIVELNEDNNNLTKEVTVLSTNIRRVTFNQNSSRKPSIAIDSDGNIHIVWQENWKNWEIFYKKLAPDGSVLVNDTRLTYTANASINPKVAVDSAGNVYVVWLEESGRSYTYNDYHVYFTKLDSNGNVLVGPTRIDATAYWEGKVRLHDIAVDSSDNLCLLWEQYTTRLGGNWNKVWFGRFNDTGSPVGDILCVAEIGGLPPLKPGESPSHAYSLYPSFALDSSDNVHIVFNKRYKSIQCRCGPGWGVDGIGQTMNAHILTV